MPGFEPVDPRTRRVRLTLGRAAVEVAPGVGARLAGLEVDGWDLLRRDGPDDLAWGAFVVAPWAGRVRDARVAWGGATWELGRTETPRDLHGLVLARPWLVADASGRTVRMEMSLGPDWPTGGRIVHTVTLEEDRIRLRLEVHAELEPTPAIVGWRPWFHRRATRLVPSGRDAIARDSIEEALRSGNEPRLLETDDVEVVVEARRRLELDEAGLPTGALVEPRGDPRDDVLLGAVQPPVLRYPGGPTLRLTAGTAAAWLVDTTHPDAVCVGPVTGPPDGINGGILGEPPVATPLNPIVATFDIAWA